MASKARTEHACIASAMDDMASADADMVFNAMMIRLIENHERRQAEALASIDALLERELAE